MLSVFSSVWSSGVPDAVRDKRHGDAQLHSEQARGAQRFHPAGRLLYASFYPLVLFYSRGLGIVVLYVYKYLVANATLFDFLFHRFVMRRVHFTYSSFVLRLHGDVDVRWSEGLFDLELH
jgi:hypothetical protein